jgi:hypothetical protein
MSAGMVRTILEVERCYLTILVTVQPCFALFENAKVLIISTKQSLDGVRGCELVTAPYGTVVTQTFSSRLVIEFSNHLIALGCLPT